MIFIDAYVILNDMNTPIHTYCTIDTGKLGLCFEILG